MLLLIGLAACPRPERDAPQLQGVGAAELLKALLHSGAQHQQAVGLVELDYAAVDGFFKGQADVAVARPNRLRVELRSFFGQPAGALAADGERFVFVDNLNTRVLQGAVEAPALTALLPLGLPLQTSVPLLLGALPELGAGSTRYIRPQHAALALEHRAGARRWQLELGADGRHLQVLRCLDAEASELFAIRYSAHQDQAGLAFAHQGSAEVRGRAGAVRWRWEDVELNGPALPADAWQLVVPPGYSVEEAPH